MSGMQKAIEAIKKGDLYSCIGSLSLGRGELIDIIKEYDYAISKMERIGDTPQEIYDSIADELAEQYQDDFE